MKTFQAHEARSNFSAILDEALANGPVRVSRHGRETVVVVSEAEWTRRTRPAPSFGELLANAPIEPGDLPERRAALGEGAAFE